MADKDLRINGQIRVREVLLIGDHGEKQVISTRQALEMAQQAGMDLVEVASHAQPPVAKIMDYGKYKYENDKKIRALKKNQTLVKLKEVRMQPKIAGGDLDVKAKHISEFLAEGSKVKVTIRFRGRELAHTELGRDVMNEILKRIEGEYVIDKGALMEGRNMSMTVSPKAKK